MLNEQFDLIHDLPDNIREIANKEFKDFLNSSHNLLKADLVDALLSARSNPDKPSFVRIKKDDVTSSGETINWLLQGFSLRDEKDMGYVFLVDVEEKTSVYQVFFSVVVTLATRQGCFALLRVRRRDSAKRTSDLYYADIDEINSYGESFLLPIPQPKLSA